MRGFLYLQVRKENTEGANHTPFVQIPQAVTRLEGGKGGKLISTPNHRKLSGTEGWRDGPLAKAVPSKKGQLTRLRQARDSHVISAQNPQEMCPVDPTEGDCR